MTGKIGSEAGPNFRDFGQAIRAGRLFRSAQPDRFSNPSFSKVIFRHRIRTIIDLRMIQEASQDAPIVLPEGCHRLHLPFVYEIEARWDNPRDLSAEAIARRYVEILAEALPNLATIFRVFTEPPRYPILIHCASGRDRTGLTSAILLDLLGAPREYIAEDYARSDAAALGGIPAEAETMLLFLEAVVKEFGGCRSLLLAAGMSTTEITEIQAALVPGHHANPLWEE